MLVCQTTYGRQNVGKMANEKENMMAYFTLFFWKGKIELLAKFYLFFATKLIKFTSEMKLRFGMEGGKCVEKRRGKLITYHMAILEFTTIAHCSLALKSWFECHSFNLLSLLLSINYPRLVKIVLSAICQKCKKNQLFHTHFTSN